MIRDCSKRILVEQEFYPEFFFHVLHSASGKSRYHVTASDRKGQNVFFKLQPGENGFREIFDASKTPWLDDIYLKTASEWFN